MQPTTPSDEFTIRSEKVARLREAGEAPYADRFETTHSLVDAKQVADDDMPVAVAGRVVAFRSFGKLVFAHIQDAEGKLQVAAQKDTLVDSYDSFKENVDVGDYIGVVGPLFTTRTGERTVRIDRWQLLSKALRPLPDKFHGVADTELLRRERYLELISNPQAVRRFKIRSLVVQKAREFLHDNGFIEVDTPVLTNKASGALATPFVTHYDALSTEVFLRIAPETYLKRAVASGFNRVFEVARCFRNEGIDPSHLPDFTMIEFYAAYWNYRDNMRFTKEMVRSLVSATVGDTSITYGGSEIQLGGEWPELTFRDLIHKDCGIDIDTARTKPTLLHAIKAAGISIGDEAQIAAASYGTLVDLLYKKVSRPKLVNPTFVTAHPIDISPLARTSDGNPNVVDRFQLVLNGWEVVNAYSELIDPIDQRARLEAQAAARSAGDDQAMQLDEDFLECMEHGMPPMSGWGMGVDRFVSLLTDCDNLRDVVLFPLLRPE
jgi:lysyl-tRNA synthetase, class II